MWTLPFLDVVFCEQTRAGAEEGARIDPLLYCIDDSIDQFVVAELHDVVKEGDTVTVTVNEDVDYNGKKYPIASLPENLMSIIQAGGLVKAMRKLNGLD